MKLLFSIVARMCLESIENPPSLVSWFKEALHALPGSKT